MVAFVCGGTVEEFVLDAGGAHIVVVGRYEDGNVTQLMTEDREGRKCG
jgi:hypothetical protein